MKTPTAANESRRAQEPISIPPIFAQAEASISATINEAKTYIRREPTEAVLFAVIAGYVMRMLPLGAILNLVARLVFLALRPAIIIFGATKIWGVVRDSSLLNERRH